MSTTATPPARRIRRTWLFVGLAVATVVVLVAIVAVVAVSVFSARAAVDAYTISSGAMENTLQPDDKIIVNKKAGAPQRGAIVVYTAPEGWQAPQGEKLIHRMVGMAGDHVVCCDAAGKIAINGYVLTESYLYPGSAPSTIRFDVKVPAGRIFVLGDHRDISGDSRYHLGNNFGTIPVTSVVGSVTMIYAPQSRAGKITIPEIFSHVP